MPALLTPDVPHEMNQTETKRRFSLRLLPFRFSKGADPTDPADVPEGGAEPPSPSRVLVPLALSMAVIAAVGTFMVLHAPHKHETVYEKYLMEAFKALLQVGTVLFLGSVVNFLLQDFTYRRQKADEAAERARVESDKAAELARARAEQKLAFQKDILRSLTHSFTEVKGIHRTLAAKGVTKVGSERMILKDVYDEQMLALSRAELTLETVWYDTISAHDLFSKPSLTFSDEVSASGKARKAQEKLAALVKASSSDKPQVYHIVEIMKDYLRNIIHIYEEQYPMFADSSSLTLSRFISREASTIPEQESSLEDFLDDGDDWDVRFVAAYRLASSAIRKDIINPEGEP